MRVEKPVLGLPSKKLKLALPLSYFEVLPTGEKRPKVEEEEEREGKEPF